MPTRPWIYFRPENSDAGFIAGLREPAPFDGAIIASRYLAPYPEGAPQGDPDALPDVLARKHLHFVSDPGTPELTMPSFASRASRRHRQSPIASALDLPLNVAVLRDERALRHLVEIVLATQTRASGLVPPYLELQVRDRGELALNLELLAAVAAAADDRRVVTFVQCSLKAFLRGKAAEVAQAYGQAGARHVVLRIRELRNEEMTRREFELYLEAIDAFEQEQVELTVDCTGRAGPPLVAGRAAGIATGWLHFRSVAKRPFGSGGPGSAPGRYEVPGGYADIPTAEASTLPAERQCSFKNCRAHLASASPSALRLHFFHVLRQEADEAARLGPSAYGERLMRVGGNPAGWGQALVERARRAA